MTVFLEKKMDSSPLDSDVKKLDRVYHSYIQPTLDELKIPVNQKIAGLFNESMSFLFVVFGNRSRELGRVLGSWEQTKENYITKPGFSLSNERKLKIGREYLLRGYTGKGNTGFNLNLFIEWILDADGVSREVVIDDKLIPSLHDRIEYTELESRGAEVDRVIVVICRKIMEEVESRSGG